MPPPPASPARYRALPGAIWALGFVSMLMDVSSEMIHAALPVYLVVGFGASMETVGAIEGVAEAIASMVKLFSGALSDRLGKRKLLAALGYGLSALSKPIFPLAAGIGWIAAGRFIDRVGKGVRGAPRDALIADVTAPDERGAAFGLRQALDTVGAFVGPLLAILFLWAASDDFRPLLWAASLPALLSVLVLVVFVRDPPARRADAARPVSVFAGWRRLGSAYWLVASIASAFALARFSEAFLILRAEAVGLPLTLAPLALVAMNVVYALAAYPAGALSDRFDRLGMTAFGFALLILADLALAYADGLGLVALGVGLWGLHLAFTQGLLAALVADSAPPELRGAAFGVYNFGLGLALLVANALAGWLWDAHGARAAFLAGAGATALGLAGLALFSRRLRRVVEGRARRA